MDKITKAQALAAGATMLGPDGRWYSETVSNRYVLRNTQGVLDWFFVFNRPSGTYLSISLVPDDPKPERWLLSWPDTSTFRGVPHTGAPRSHSREFPSKAAAQEFAAWRSSRVDRCHRYTLARIEAELHWQPPVTPQGNWKEVPV